MQNLNKEPSRQISLFEFLARDIDKIAQMQRQQHLLEPFPGQIEMGPETEKQTTRVVFGPSSQSLKNLQSLQSLYHILHHHICSWISTFWD